MSKIGKILTKLMLLQGKFSEYELAESTGVSQSTINRILSGEVQEPSQTSIKRLSDFFKLTPEQLLGDEPIQKVKIFEGVLDCNLQDNLKQLMNLSSLNEQELSNETGVAQSTINRILNGQTANPRGGSLRPIADFFNINISQLIGLEPIDFTKIANNSTLEKIGLRKVPVINFNECNKFTEFKVHQILNEIIVSAPNAKNLFATIVPDESMNPEFERGTILIVETSISPRDGDYALISLDNKTHIKEISIKGKDFFVNYNSRIRKLTDKNQIYGVIIESRKIFDR